MDFPKGQYAIIYADPPWSYIQDTHGMDPHADADKQYPTMSPAELRALPVALLAEPDSLLFLWATSPTLAEAIDLGKAWGFQYKTVAFVWDKRKILPGSYTLGQCEHCLVFKRGRIPKPRGARNVRQFLSMERGKHSAKPAEFRSRIDAMFPEKRKIELFARRPIPNHGWAVWGNEI